MKAIIISGTPGTGKSALAKLLSQKLDLKNLNLKPLLKKNSEGYDRKKQCHIINTKKLNKEIIKIIKQSKENLILSSHLLHRLPKKYVNLCIITKCSDLKKLKQRLQKRKYSKKKIEENLQCEIFDICLNEAKKKKHNILVVDTCKKIDQKKLVTKIKKKLSM